MIKKIRIADCKQVASLHLNHLQTPFRNKTGQKLLQFYYQAVCEEQGACGYVARDADGIFGFVCGVWDPRALQGVMIRRYWIKLVIFGFLQGVTQPSLILDIIHRIRNSSSEGPARKGYELRPIVVSPDQRGTGLASNLIDTLITDAHQRGYESIYLLVDGSNEIALQFYRKYGFEFNRKEIQGERTLHRFELATGKLDES